MKSPSFTARFLCLIEQANLTGQSKLLIFPYGITGWQISIVPSRRVYFARLSVIAVKCYAGK